MFYGGCFCPPHKGHFDVIWKNIKQYDALYIFIWGLGEKRHGYAPSINFQIWELYLQLLPANLQGRVHLILTGMDPRNPALAGLDIITPVLQLQRPKYIHVKIGSDYGRVEAQDLAKQLHKNLDLPPNSTVARDNQLRVNIVRRDQTNGPSATRFCQALHDAQPVDEFFPTQITPQIKQQVLALLQSSCVRL